MLFKILLVEDRPAEQRLAQEALKGWSGIHLHTVSDGLSAVNFLSKKDIYGSVPTPNLILLDVNVPKRTGHEVLEMQKKDPVLKRIPTVVFSSSTDGKDIVKCYDLHANSYVIKPTDLAKYEDVIRAIVTYWSSICARA